ncbi:PIN domain-containing protein [Rhodospira trueperi]|uniref:PIN domain-containing protein n=1 Tax=Rhodospira trueperi TaxID=69960 RepID=UPI000B82E419|nr:PIN domain-containing protein [Rhodospira trueperi]
MRLRRDGNAIISVQVLNEIAAVGRRKMRLSWADLRDFLAAIRAILPVHALTEDIHIAGLALAEDHGFSLYDAMIVASALEAGCDVLWSKDMQDGGVIKDRLRIRNPFHRHAP